MSVSHAAVHPVDDPPPPPQPVLDAGGEVLPVRPRGVRMKDVQGMPGTRGGLALRLCQFLSAAGSLCVMATTSDFPSVTAFTYLVAAVGLQSLWSLSLAIVDIYALLVKRCLQNSGVVSLFTVGDGVRLQQIRW
uniref:CASP-like protein n=1 Tax=Kalanchoe fedtschenkoi TaxID=63787 RepID=A0A7N0VDW1_KALFE